MEFKIIKIMNGKIRFNYIYSKIKTSKSNILVNKNYFN